MFASSQSHERARRARAPCLITSASPARSSRSGSVSSVATSAITRSGWWKAPIMFLPRAWLIAVLPPTEESTCASSVVGTCRNGDAALVDGGGEAGEVADHAAAQRDDQRVAPAARREQGVEDAVPAPASSWPARRRGTTISVMRAPFRASLDFAAGRAARPLRS